MPHLSTIELHQEFDRQAQRLMDLEYSHAAGMSVQQFGTLLDDLRPSTNLLSVDAIDINNGYIPFVIVVSNTLVTTQNAMERVRREDKKGIVDLHPLTPIDFEHISEASIPQSAVYLLIDIDRGKDTLNVPPSLALTTIHDHKRTPLTIDEGVAIITQYPEFLSKNNCFSLLASRTGRDKRVPAIWINANKEPNLGWCWEGNPHTWLGSASASYRIGT